MTRYFSRFCTCLCTILSLKSNFSFEIFQGLQFSITANLWKKIRFFASFFAATVPDSFGNVLVCLKNTPFALLKWFWREIRFPILWNFCILYSYTLSMKLSLHFSNFLEKTKQDFSSSSLNFFTHTHEKLMDKKMFLLWDYKAMSKSLSENKTM